MRMAPREISLRLAIALLAALALVAVLAAPPATARHVGPCTHEYLEAALDAPSDFREGGFRQALGEAGYAVGSCLDGTVAWACNTVRCDRITIDCGRLCGTLP